MTVTTWAEPEKGLEDVILSYLTEADGSAEPNRQEFLDRFPQLASELKTFFADQDEAAHFLAPIRNIRPAGPAVPVPSSFGDYELLREIARGGMGVVFQARQSRLNRTVAVKMILAGQLASPADVQRFQTEAKAGAHLDHPNIVPIYEVGEHLGQHYFSMKLMEGGSLAEQIDCGQWRVVSTDQQRAVRLLATVARAVAHAHERGILHRDLKPGNILFDTHGQPYVADFGLPSGSRQDRPAKTNRIPRSRSAGPLWVRPTTWPRSR